MVSIIYNTFEFNTIRYTKKIIKFYNNLIIFDFQRYIQCK